MYILHLGTSAKNGVGLRLPVEFIFAHLSTLRVRESRAMHFFTRRVRESRAMHFFTSFIYTEGKRKPRQGTTQVFFLYIVCVFFLALRVRDSRDNALCQLIISYTEG